MYHGWADALPPDVEVAAIQLPGRESRLLEPPFRRLPDLIQALAGAVGPLLTRPAVFYGHSMGALLAFELARELRRRSMQLPVQLIVSGRQAPQTPEHKSPVSHLPDADLIAQIRRYNGTPPAVLENRELMELVLPALRADFAVCESYRYTPEPPLPCGIAAWGGWEDSEVSPEEIAAWEVQTSSSFSYRMFPGDHFFIQSQRDLVLRAMVGLLRDIAGQIDQ